MASLFAHAPCPAVLPATQRRNTVSIHAHVTQPRSALLARPAAGAQRRWHSTSWVLQAVKADAAVDQLTPAEMKLIADITKVVDDRLAATVSKHSAAAQNVQAPPTSALRAKVVTAIKKLSTGLLEREMEVRLLVLAALCGEHLLLLGPPGTAKSELSRRLSGITGGAYFERLLTRFSVPEELFGPLSMKGAWRESRAGEARRAAAGGD